MTVSPASTRRLQFRSWCQFISSRRVPTRFVQKYTVRVRLEPSGAHEAGFRPPCRRTVRRPGSPFGRPSFRPEDLTPGQDSSRVRSEVRRRAGRAAGVQPDTWEHRSMTWQCRRCGRTVDLVLRDGDRCAAPPARCGSAPAGRCRTTTARPTFGSSRCVSCCNRRRLRLAMPARRMLSGKPSTRREVISGTLRHEGARRSRALRAVPPDVHLIPRREQRRPRAGGPVSKLTELAVIRPIGTPLRGAGWVPRGSRPLSWRGSAPRRLRADQDG